MGAHKFGQKIPPLYMDRDSDAKVIESEKGAIRYALNSRSGSVEDGTQGIFENIKGNVLIPNNLLPAGTNKCIGNVEDPKHKRLIFFNYNSNGKHGIYIYIPEQPGTKVFELYTDTSGEVLDFSPVMEISTPMVSVVDGKYLVWTDGYNPHRFLDIEKALLLDKKRQWEFQLYGLTEKFDIDITTPTGNYHLDQKTVGDLEGITDPLCPFTAEVCDSKTIFTEKSPGYIISFEISTGRLVPLNFYPTTHNERQIDLILWPPNTGPEVKLKYDAKVKRNLISGNPWQFRVKYNYKGGFSSVWSPWSKAIATADDVSQLFNYIEIDYTARIFNELNLLDHLFLIDSVEIGYRNSNDGKLNSFITIDQCNIGKNIQTVNFYNDVFATVQKDTDDVKQYDSVPLKSGALTLARDRITVGDNIENYEVPCVDYELEVAFTPADKLKTGSIVGRVYVHNYVAAFDNKFDDKYITAQPIGIYSGDKFVFGGMNANYAGEGDWVDTSEHEQYLPDGGFYVYLVGTDIYAKTKQIRVADAGVQYYDQENNIIDLTSKDNREKYRHHVDNGGKIYSEFRMDNVPAGKYIIAVASHWCSVSDKLGKGDHYIVDTSNKYQKTSTYVCNIQPDGSARFDHHHKLDGIKQFVIEVLPGVDNRADDIIVEDLSDPAKGVATSARAISGYVIDAGGEKYEQTDLKTGNTVEGCYVEYHPNKSTEVDPIHLKCRTDHNGFFYTVFVNEKLNVGDGNNGWVEVKIADRQLNKQHKRLYEATLTDLYSGTLTNGENWDINYGANTHHSLIIPNTDTYVSQNYLTIIKGSVLSNTNVPLKGFAVVCEGTNRVVLSEQDGGFNMLIYRPYDSAQRVGSLFYYDRTNTLTNIVTEQAYNVTSIGSTYTFAVPFIQLPVQILVKNLEELQFYLKAGGLYDFGVAFADRANRKTTTQYNEKQGRLKIPFTTELIKDYFPNLSVDTNGDPITATTKADGYFTVNFKLKDKPAIWTTHAYVERTPDQVYSDYIQFVVSNVKYVDHFDSSAENPVPVETTYASGTATEIYLDLGTSFTEYQDRNSSSAKGWAFEKGDRLRFIYKKDGTVRNFYETEIKDQRGNFFVIDNITSLGAIEPGEIVEVFRLKTQVQDKLFYETGEFFKVLNPYTFSRAWESDTVTLNTGDAYRRIRKMYQVEVSDTNEHTLKNIYRTSIEDPSPFDSLTGKDNDVGRPDLINNTIKQLRREAAIRFSGKYNFDGTANGLRSFDALDIVESNQDYGPITVLSDFQDLLFVAQVRKCHTRLIQKAIVSLGDNQTNILANPNRFLDQPYYLEKENGCTNPESFARNSTYAKFLDAFNGEVIQYSRQNGLVNISGFDSRYDGSKNMDVQFKTIPGILKQLSRGYIKSQFRAYGCYDNTNMEYTLTIKPLISGSTRDLMNGGKGANMGDKDDQFGTYTAQPITGVTLYPDTTLVYSDKMTYWTGFRSYSPERYGSVANGYVMFKDGQLWHSELNPLYNYFFGAQAKQRLSVIMNQEPSVVKDFLTWSLETDTNWTVYNVEVPQNRMLMRKQASKYPKSMNRGYDRGYFGNFLKDMNTPSVANPLHEGVDLAGETILFEIENEESVKTQLFAVNIFAQYIPRSGT